jgi:ParB family transcriptional regulator, chromosome partitioning protein
MRVVDVPFQQIHAAVWNPNQMDEAMRARLCRSIERFGMVVPLVVRHMGQDSYETIGGAQRLTVLQELQIDTVPCVVVEANDAHARLLAQALNRIQGQDDLGLQAELIREVLQSLPQEEVLQLLPETAQGLQALSSLGQEVMADYLKNWQQAQAARLKHLTFRFNQHQIEVVEEALAQIMPQVRETGSPSPNTRGTALYFLCKAYLEQSRRTS